MQTNYKLILPVAVTLLLFVVFKVAEHSSTEKEAERPAMATNQASILPFSTNNNAIEPENNVMDDTAPQRIRPVRINNNIFFAGEQMPLYDLEVRERFDREILVNTFWHSNTMLNYKLANKYFGVIEPILAEYGVPDDFKYLAIAESGLRNVVSPAGAAGFWQFMKKTGVDYDLEINGEVDERYHLELATAAACQYLLEAKRKFGTWTLAAASYNMGMAGINNKLEEQKVDNYYDLYLNRETSRYIFRVMAYKLVFEDPKAFGYHFTEEDLYDNYAYKEVIVTDSIDDLAQYAIDRGTNYKILVTLNPWLVGKSLTISAGNSYIIRLPY